MMHIVNNNSVARQKEGTKNKREWIVEKHTKINIKRMSN